MSANGASMDDDALETLLFPFENQALDWPAEGGILFLRAQAGPGLDAGRRAGLIAVQSAKPLAAGLERLGLTVLPAAPDGQRFALVLALMPRQREEARALLGEAVLHLAPGGRIVAAARNAEGARSHEADLERLAGRIESFSKNKARVFWSIGEPDRALAAEWQALDAPRPIADGTFLSRPGLFAWDRIDPGSALLAEHLPPTLAGLGADLGAGFGYLSARVLERCARVKGLDLYEAEKRGLDLAERNLAGARVPIRFFWHDVTQGLGESYDFVVTNPPFHKGRADRTDLGQAFIRAAASALKPGGRLLLVANRHLPYETLMRTLFAEIAPLADRDGYKVIEARKGGR